MPPRVNREETTRLARLEKYFEFKEVSNVKVNYLSPFELENKHENICEIDWTSPPIYDEYFDDEI